MNKSTKKLADFRSWFNRFITRSYGKPCKDFTWSCAVCHANAVKTILDDFVGEEIALERWNQEQNTKPKKQE